MIIMSITSIIISLVALLLIKNWNHWLREEFRKRHLSALLTYSSHSHCPGALPFHCSSISLAFATWLQDIFTPTQPTYWHVNDSKMPRCHVVSPDIRTKYSNRPSARLGHQTPIGYQILKLHDLHGTRGSPLVKQGLLLTFQPIPSGSL